MALETRIYQKENKPKLWLWLWLRIRLWCFYGNAYHESNKKRTLWSRVKQLAKRL